MPDTADLIRAAQKPRKGGRSAVFWYLWDRYDRLAELPDGLNYAEIAAFFAANKVHDGSGRPPTKRAVADTWRKVKALKKSGPVKRRARVNRSRVNRAFRSAVAGKSRSADRAYRATTAR